MKPLCIYFLAFLTLWMSTWLVTDVHEWSMLDDQHTHAQISTASVSLMTTVQNIDHDHEHHSGICSYDHGGHVGQVLATVIYSTAFIPTQNSTIPISSEFWHTQISPPKLRPPIA